MDLPSPSGPLTIILGFCLICEATAQVVINEIGAASSDHLLRSHPDGRPRVGWGTSWCEPTFDDADWEEGSTPFGFGVDGIATSLGDEMLGRTPSVYLRRTFSVSADEAALNEPFVLTSQADSGFVAYINGREIARANLGRENGFVYHGQSAFSSAQSDEMLEYTSGMLASEVLQAGQNVLAVQVQNTVPSHINERDQTIDETLKFEATLSIGASAEISLRVDGWKYRVGHAEPSGGVVDWSQVAHPDVEGDYSDWIELHNTSAEEVDLSGWHLTDDDDQPKLWTFLDNTTIAAGGYLLVLADGNTEMPGDYLHASFKLSADGEFLGLSDAAGEFVSQFEGGFPKQYPFLSYGVGANGALTYFDLPTPGVANSGTEIMGVVKKPKFDPAGGVYENTVSVTIASRTEDAVIRYTIDGSEPTEANGTLYEGPISIEPIDDRTGTPIRARAFKEGLSPSADGTQTYLVGIDDAFNTIPTLSLVADSGEAFYKPHGIMSVAGLSTPRMVNEYYMPAMHGRSYERKISMEVLYPDDGTNVQIDGGLRLSASAFSRFNFSLGNTDASPWPSESPQKPSFNLFLRNDYGNDTLNFPFVENFPVRQFRQFRLRAGKNDIVSPFIVDELARRIFTDTGQFGAVGVQHALFVNGSYKGYYNSVARIREPLFQDLYGSGDIPWQVKHIDVWADGSPLDNKLEDTDEWKNLERLLRKDLKDLENYKAVTDELDPVSFADYFIVNVYGATEDWPNNNLVIARELSDVGRWRAYVWDAEVCFGVQSSHSITHDSIATDLSQLDRTPSNDLATVWSHLIRSPEWRLLFADRLQKHFFTPGGALTKANLTRRTDELAAEIAPLMAFSGPVIDTSEIAEWVEGREDVLFAGGLWEKHKLWGDVPVPAFSPAGGAVVEGSEVTISIPETPRTSVYYTTDGSDPRLLGGDLNPEAILLDPDVGFVVESTSTVRARSRMKTVFTTTWGAVSESTYRVGLEHADSSNFLISELLVDPESASEEEKTLDFSTSNFEYIEFYNLSDVAIDLADLRFTAGIDYVFGEGDVTTIGPKAYGVIVNDRQAFVRRYGDGLPILGEYNKKLSNGGEHLEISNSRFKPIVSVTYSNNAPWPANTNDEGNSLVFSTLVADTDPNDPANWTASSLKGGTPGRAVGQGPPDPDLLEAVQLAADSFAINTQEKSILFTLTQRIDNGLLYTLEFSSDLQAWQGTPVADLVEMDSNPGGEGLRRVTYRKSFPSEDGQTYARWRVELAP